MVFIANLLSFGCYYLGTAGRAGWRHRGAGVAAPAQGCRRTDVHRCPACQCLTPRPDPCKAKIETLVWLGRCMDDAEGEKGRRRMASAGSVHTCCAGQPRARRPHQSPDDKPRLSGHMGGKQALQCRQYCNGFALISAILQRR